MLLQENFTNGVLSFKSLKTGNEYAASAENTLLASEERSQTYNLTRYRNTLKTTAYDTTNPRVRLEKGCENCSRKIVSYQRLGLEKKIFYACICGNSWHT
jgi:hypothetical protein